MSRECRNEGEGKSLEEVSEEYDATGSSVRMGTEKKQLNLVIKK